MLSPIAGCRRARRLVRRGRLAVPELRAGSFDDLREADHRDGVLHRDRTGIDLLQELDRVLEPAELRVVMLDVPRRKVLTSTSSITAEKIFSRGLWR
jgi:hypothetical protein